MTVRSRAEAAVESASSILKDWSGINHRMGSRAPGLRAASYDTTPSGPVAWCDLHEQDVPACRKAGHFCTGVPLAGGSDPTGDQAVNNPTHDHGREFLHHISLGSHHFEQAARIAARYNDASPYELDQAIRENDRSTCEVCARHGRTSTVLATSDVKGNLNRDYRLCRDHWGFVDRHGELPKDDEESHKSRIGKFPPRRVRQTDRLRRAAGKLKAGDTSVSL